MKETCLHDKHVALGALMSPFGGFDMPIQYSGIIDEHNAVRQHVGMFDVSHMGEIWVKGPKALGLLQRITTNDVSKLYDGKVQYTCMPNGRGGIVDDILVYRIDAETFTVEKQFKFKLGDWPSEVQLNGDRDKLYWINKAIWSMDVTASHVPVRPFLEYSGTLYYGLTVNPANGEVYIADAIDYQQQGMIYRYSPDGELIDEFYVGVIPGAFCWK